MLDTLEFPAALERVAEHAAGPLGARHVLARTPSGDAAWIKDALAQTAELAALLVTDDGIRAEPVPDLTDLLALLGVPGSALEGPMLRDAAAALGAARVVAAELKRLAPTAPRTGSLLVPLPPKEIEPRLVASIGPDGEVLDGASKELARARKAVREARDRLVSRLESILQGLDVQERSPDATVTVRGGRYVIPIRSTARARVGGIVHDESATRSTMFVEPPEVIELGNELRSREAAAQREVLRVLRELTELLRPQRDAIAAAWDMCIAFDDLCARSRYAVEVNGFAPEMGDGPLAIRLGRHPLLSSTSGGEVVAFDLELAPDEWTILVSGPNTGGKTVLIKAVGLLSLLAQSGIIPPLGSGSRLPVFHSVFADIGDRQSIAASLSTFSAHVAVLRDILTHARAGSLVLLDEIGSGTDPAEGAALAGAVLRALTRRHAVTLATTHLGALKQLATQTVGIVNASLQFDAETMTPTYRFLKGVPGRSYGLAIARRLGVDPAVTSEAERAVPDVERSLDALLADVERRAKDLETLKVELDATAHALAADKERLDARGDDLAGRAQALKTRERTLEANARAQAREYLLEARKTVEAALAQARAAVDEATAKQARKLVEQAIEKTEEETVEQAKGWMSLDELRRQLPATGALTPGRRPGVNQPVQSSASTTATTEVSLRGMRVDEADAVLERALDQAVLADLPYLRIIHGKGTGVLRQLVYERLSGDPRVKRFGFAPANQGGHGVTVAELG
ncbi:MAG TPA: Smr/MutS family protein [Gemmatimonadales bacterium]